MESFLYKWNSNSCFSAKLLVNPVSVLPICNISVRADRERKKKHNSDVPNGALPLYPAWGVSRPQTPRLCEGHSRLLSKYHRLLQMLLTALGSPTGLCPCTLLGASAASGPLACVRAFGPHNHLRLKYHHLLQILLTALNSSCREKCKINYS